MILAAAFTALAFCRSGAAQGLVLHVAPSSSGAEQGDGSQARPFRDLYKAVASARAAADQLPASDSSGVTLALDPGDYELSPHPMIEPTCGNCENPAEPVAITVGLLVSGRRIRIVGAGGALARGRSTGTQSVIHTRSGYGLLFQDCSDCVLKEVVLTGGIRDTSGKATDAALVVQRSSVLIENCELRDNIGDPALIEKNVVGIIGIAGREGSRIHAVGNAILRNSWDGIALYREARAEIVNNRIDGVDLALGRTAGGGRGVGIGLTWNAQAEIRGNLVRRYWKGIGVFVDARALVEENVVEQVATWGLTLWDAGKGKPQAFFRWNAVDSTGACGASLVRASSDPPAPGHFLDNALVRTGQNPKYDTGEPYCLQTAVAVDSLPRAFRVEGNLLWQNREPGGRAGSGDSGEKVFRRRVQPLCEHLARWPAVRGSRFVREFCTIAGRESDQ